jgi:biopolymer transport protein ExbB
MSRSLQITLSVIALLVIGALLVQLGAEDVAVDAGTEPAGSGGKSLISRIFSSGPVAYVLMVVSVIGLSVAIHRLMSIKDELLLPPGLADDMHNIFGEGVNDEAIDEAIGIVQNDDSMLGQVFFSALDKKDFGYEAMRESAESVGAAQHNILMSQVNWLSLFAGIGPMLGLLGTVWGMIGAFFTMANAGGTVDAALLADDIGGAMITTAMGLIIAIPMLTLFFVLRARVNRCVLEAGVLTNEILDYFRGQ